LFNGFEPGTRGRRPAYGSRLIAGVARPVRAGGQLNLRSRRRAHVAAAGNAFRGVNGRLGVHACGR